MTAFPTLLRPMIDADRGFVVGHWIDDYWRDALPRHKGRGGEHAFSDWKPPMRGRIHAILGPATTLVACDPEDHDRLYAFASGGDAALHYLFVKHTRRRCGLGRELLSELERLRGAPYDLMTTTFATRTWAAARKGLRRETAMAANA